MRFATRMNSFLSRGESLEQVIQNLRAIDGLTDIELNYPEHFAAYSNSEIAKMISDAAFSFSGVAVRFRKDFVDGEFGDAHNTRKAIELAKSAIDTVKELGGESITIWLEFDGNDYSFQIDYENHWSRLITSLQELCDYEPGIKISIEYKPFEPRSYSITPNTGVTLHAAHQVARDNIGMTLDYCHSLMAHENPAFALTLALMEEKLFGVHLNDGNGLMDDGMIIGSATPVKTFEFLYYLKKFNFSGLVYFDTFPIRENPYWETEMNIKVFNRIWNRLDEIGMDTIAQGLAESKNQFGQSFVLNHLI
ncbi:MAG: sugar phosphate isomerase/epimerase [Sphaerochaetaceae bacterium]|nr:sugar phosphate isomerase/epimerase [Sphaerochaetaceae bacterium]